MFVAGVAQFEELHADSRRQEAGMEGATHLGAELLTVVDALRGTLDEAQRQVDHARQIQRAVTGLAGRTLQQQDLSDKFIQQLLGIDEDVFTEAVREAGPKADDAHDWQVRAELEQLWLTVRRRASVWFQIDDLGTTREGIRHNDIHTG